MMCFFGVLPPDLVAKAYAKDSVIFIFGVLAIAAAISKTGLDRRIGMLLLGRSSSLPKFTFIFAPLLAMTASFLSEHALVAFLAPILMLVYMATIRSAGLTKDKALVVMMLLLLTFSGNMGGPGSPAAGGRNAVMIGILVGLRHGTQLRQWVKLGFPFVPVMALVIAAYFYFAFRNKIKVKDLDIAARGRRESEKIGKMTQDEYKAAAVLGALGSCSGRLCPGGLGWAGRLCLCIVLLNILGILRWRDINRSTGMWWPSTAQPPPWVTGLATTGAALWLADELRIRPARFDDEWHGAVHVLQPHHRHSHQLHERRRHGGGCRTDHCAHGDAFRNIAVDGGSGNCLCFFLRSHAGHRNTEQRHRLLDGEGSGNRGTTADHEGLSHPRIHGLAAELCGPLDLGIPWVLEMDGTLNR